MSNFDELNKLKFKFSIIQIFESVRTCIFLHRSGLAKDGEEIQNFFINYNKNKENYPWYVYTTKKLKTLKN